MNARRVFLCATLPALVAACATGGGLGERLGTELVGNGNAVSFRWIAEHPWDARFRSGQPFRLLANYPAEGRGMVTEVVATARPSPAREVSFTLPSALRAVPSGPVCMFVEQSNVQIPIRPAGSADTRQFRYPAWEQSVGASSRTRSIAENLARARSAEAATDTSAGQWRARLTAQGASSEADCPRLAEAAGRAAAGTARTTIAPEQQNGAARQVCVWKARNSSVEHAKVRLDGGRELLFRLDIAKLMDAVRADAAPTDDATVRGVRAKRLADGERFLADWRANVDRLRADFRPPLDIAPGNETLPLGGASNLLLARWSFPEIARGGALNPTERLGLLAVALDGYDDCVSGTLVQLRADHSAALLRAERDPIRRRQAEERVAGECKAGFARMNELEGRRASARAEIARLEAEQAALATATAGGVAGRPVALNQIGCGT